MQKSQEDHVLVFQQYLVTAPAPVYNKNTDTMLKQYLVTTPALQVQGVPKPAEHKIYQVRRYDQIFFSLDIAKKRKWKDGFNRDGVT